MAGRSAMKISRFSPLLLALALGSGCATKALWDGNAFEDWNEPAADPNLHLYDGGKHADVLVVYDEYSERSDATLVQLRQHLLFEAVEAVVKRIQWHLY